eukprot:SAG31_NODE_360_length_17025_cov_5.362460_10_plen_296_part_00
MAPTSTPTPLMHVLQQCTCRLPRGGTLKRANPRTREAVDSRNHMALLFAAVSATGVAATTPLPPAGVLPSCSLAGYTFATFCQEHATCGNATGRIAASVSSPRCGRADMLVAGTSAASAAFASPLFAVDPVAVYNVSWLVNTSFRVQKGGTVAGTVVAQFYDKHDMNFGPTRDADGWTPALDAVCEKASTAGLFEPRSFSFSAPTTAVAARLWLIFADGHLTHSTATGVVSIADVQIVRVPHPTQQQQQLVPAPRFHVPDPTIQRGINMSTVRGVTFSFLWDFSRFHGTNREIRD